MRNANVNFAKRPTLMRGSRRWATEEQKQRRSDGEPVCGLAWRLTMAAAGRADKSEGGHANTSGQCWFLCRGGWWSRGWAAWMFCTQSGPEVDEMLLYLRKLALGDVTKIPQTSYVNLFTWSINTLGWTLEIFLESYVQYWLCWYQYQPISKYTDI